MARAGVKPARLALRPVPVVTSVIDEPLRIPPMRLSALDLPPAHPAYCVESREKSPPGRSAAMAALAAKEPATKSAPKVRCMFICRLRNGSIHYGRVPQCGSVGGFEGGGGPAAPEAVGNVLQLKFPPREVLWNTAFRRTAGRNGGAKSRDKRENNEMTRRTPFLRHISFRTKI